MVDKSGIFFSDINLSFGDKEVLKGLSGYIPKGEIVCIVGPSGCGKSTLINILSGFLEINSGNVIIDGEHLSGIPGNIGVVFQDYSLFPWLSVKENIAFGKNIQKFSKEEREEKIKNILKKIGLEEESHRYPYELSGGMNQRVSIGRTIANNSQYILMDEPFGVLDYQTKLKMYQFLLKIWEDLEKTIVIVTHNIEEAILLSDRIFMLPLKKGKNLEEIKIDILRPRDISNPKFSVYKDKILNYLEEEVTF